MSKKENEAWWNDITSDEAALMIGYRVTPRQPFSKKAPKPPKLKRTSAASAVGAVRSQG